ncbi:hypothetical protein NFG60_02195 [Alteromonas macleodii]|nr:hypothetical protein [Alteromonas macleodii]USI30099.1 hypothetical protein NFG60_02195 [Alteromonas macleodii]
MDKGWTFVKAGRSSHAFGKLRCGNGSHQGHTMSVWSTPVDDENHARQIRKKVDQCK